ncbi:MULTISPECIES: acyl carrier protein [unclassified Pseudoalteromonas]|uniref:acyl carrier protein n=1 Tax=unclassified Pseudoalteromonas TaxID=194690 RepID=UPI001407DE1A|nr:MULTISPECIES: acyl carrier protein [unclassified Pseudoalteromonas]MBH0027704.1 acyl carrier protein [Pseudoalteromonas sp. SWN29]
MKSGEQIFAMLSDILQEYFEIEPEDITRTASLYEDLDLDSIDAVDLVVKLREQTGKKIEPDDFKQVRTVQDVIDAIEKLMVVEA